MNKRLIHDSAWAGSIHVIEIFKNLIQPEEEKDAFGEVYDALHQMLQAFVLLQERERRQLDPSKN